MRILKRGAQRFHCGRLLHFQQHCGKQSVLLQQLRQREGGEALQQKQKLDPLVQYAASFGRP